MTSYRLIYFYDTNNVGGHKLSLLLRDRREAFHPARPTMPTIFRVPSPIPDIDRPEDSTVRLSCSNCPALQTSGGSFGKTVYVYRLPNEPRAKRIIGATQMLYSLWESFDREFGPDMEDIHTLSKHVKEEIALAKARTDYRDQQLQKIDRKYASRARAQLRTFFQGTNQRLQEIQQQQLLRSNQRERTTPLFLSTPTNSAHPHPIFTRS